MKRIALFGLSLAGILLSGCTQEADEVESLQRVVGMYLSGLQGEQWSVAESAWSRRVPPQKLKLEKEYFELLFKAYDLEYKMESFDLIDLDDDFATARVKYKITRAGGEDGFTDQRITSIYTFTRTSGAWRILDSMLEKTEDI